MNTQIIVEFINAIFGILLTVCGSIWIIGITLYFIKGMTKALLDKN